MEAREEVGEELVLTGSGEGDRFLFSLVRLAEGGLKEELLGRRPGNL